MRAWISIIVAGAVSGTLFVLALPPTAHGWLGWFALAPLLFASHKQGFLKGFVGGIAAGMAAAYVSTTPLVAAPILQGGDIAWNYVGFGLYGIVIAIATGIYAEVKSLTPRTVLLTAAAATLLECITFIKMPAHVALTQFTSPAMMGVASVTGIWGVSWLVWLSNISIASLAASNHRLPAALVAAGSAAVGWVGTSPIPDAAIATATSPRPYAVLQTEAFGATELLAKQQPLAAVRPSLAVWPELSTASYDADAIQQFVDKPGAWPVVTTCHDDAQPKPHNAARVYSANTQTTPYHKRKPFGSEANEIQAGTKPVVVKTVSENVGLNICFDSCYPGVMRDTVLAGPVDVIALPTLDPKSPNGFIQAAHAAFTPFRAAELGVPIVRAETTAWSMVVEPSGRIAGYVPTGADGPYAIATHEPTRQTFYKKHGDWFLWAMVGALFLSMAESVSKGPRRPTKETVGP